MQVRAVEHVECVGWRADHRLAAAVEGGVEADAVAAQAFELFEEGVVAGVGVLCHDLCAGGAVFVDDFRDAWLPVLGHVEGEGHVRCWMI